MASTLGITTANIQAKLAPVSGSLVFSIGDTAADSLSSSECLAIIEAQEQRAFSLLAERQRQLVSGIVDGEVVARRSIEGQTEYQLSVYPVVTGSVSVYVNLPKNVAWKDRKLSHRFTDFVIDTATGELTLGSAPDANSLIVVHYRHSNQSAYTWIKECVRSFVALEISRRYSFFRTTDGQERFEGWEAQSLGTLKDIAKSGQTGVDALDELQLIDDVRPDMYRQFFVRPDVS